MIRFVDLREAETGWNFAFYDTVTDRFVQDDDGAQAWDTWGEFEEGMPHALFRAYGAAPRFRALCPEWVFSATMGKCASPTQKHEP